MKRLLPLAALVVTAWVVYLSWPSAVAPVARAPEPAPSPTPSTAEAGPAPAQTPVDPGVETRNGCVFEDDARLAYDLRLRAQSEIIAQLLGQPGNQPVLTRSEQRMRMELRVVEPTDAQAGDPAVLLAKFVEPAGSGTQRLPKSLGEPFLLRVDDRCELTGFARTRTVDRAEARLQQGFAYELNLYWADAGSRTRTIDNATGRARAEFGARVEHGERTIEKSVLRYDELWRSSGGLVLDFDREPEQSATTAVMGDGPWFERLDKKERLTGPAGASLSAAQASRVEPSPDALDRALYVPDQFVWENLLPEQIRVQSPDEVTALDEKARKAVRHFTPEQAAQRFMQRFERGTGIQDVWPELTHYLEARPATTDALVSKMKRDEISTAASPAFYIALGRARTPQARDALLDIMRDEIAPPIERIRAMFALTDRQDVGVPLAKELAVMSRNVTRGRDDTTRVLGREALLALGALAGLHDDQEVKRVAVQAAGLVLSEGEDAIEMRPAYGAMANVGDPQYLDVAGDGSKSRDPRVREAAAIVVRRMHPDDTSDFVASWLARETDPYVKEALYTTVDLQTIDHPVPVGASLIDQALKDLEKKPRVITRKAILHILGRAVGKYPRAREALVRQIPYELQTESGIYDVIVRYLDPDEVRAAIANVGEVIDRGR